MADFEFMLGNRDVQTRRWELIFLGAQQPVLPISFVGQNVGDELHLEASLVGDPEKRFRAAVRFYDISSDSFESDPRITRNAGDTWYYIVTMTAHRSANSRP